MTETQTPSNQLAEILHPSNTPEMAFQSYSVLGGDEGYRKEQKAAFMRGDIMLPILDYPDLEECQIKAMLPPLEGVLGISDTLPEETTRGAVWGSAGYRMAEMYWLLSNERLGRIHPRLLPTEVDALSVDVQDKNEQLYGKPEEAITQAVLAETWAQIDAKELSGEGLCIKGELENGTTVHVAGQDVYIGPLARGSAERLPQIPSDLLATLKERLYTDHADAVKIVEDYWNNVIQVRPEGERVFTPQDMYDVFKAVHTMRDPENASGVDVVLAPDATALSWETPLMAVKVGGKRAPIDNLEEMLSKVYHEYIVHGGRAVAGSATTLPVLGTGMYTEADDGELTDYLTFEEGLASMCELSAMPEGESSWDSSTTERYMAVSLAYEGKDFREIYETLWRARALMSAKSGVDVTESDITQARNYSYGALVRIFRGTPMDLPRVNSDGTPRILTFNKDLAYLRGKIQMIGFWEQYKNDPDMIDLLFKAKFDPLNKRQMSIVRGVYGV